MADLAGVEKQLTANESNYFYHIGDGLHYLLFDLREDYAMLHCIITSCPGRALWQNGSLCHLEGHDHLPSPLFPAQLQLRKRILDRVANGDPAPYRYIFSEESSQFPRAVQVKIKWELMYIEMKAARLSLPPKSESLQEVAAVLQQPEYSFLAATMDGQDNMFSKFLQNTNSLVLCSARNAFFLGRVRSVICVIEDLETHPNLQLLALIGKFSNYALPLVYCLQETRNVSYSEILKHLRDINSSFDPEVIVCPYDIALKDAWREVYPRAEILNRFHHQFIQDLIQYIKTMPIVLKNVKKVFALCCAIPFVPHAWLHEAFRFVNEEAMQDDLYEEMLPFFDYVWQNWLTGPRYDEEAVSVSAHDICSCNVAVSFKNMMKKAKIFPSCNVFFLVGSFAEIEATIQADVEKLDEGMRIDPARRITSLLNKRLLQRLVDRIITIEEYMNQMLPSLFIVLEPVF